MTKLLISNIGTLYSLAEFDGTSGRAAGSIRPIESAEVEIEDGRVVYAGPERHEPTGSRADGLNPYPPTPSVSHPSPGLTRVDAHGALVTPGLVDPHTHTVYGGDRAFELPLKIGGVPYLQILASGGGILSTVRSTRGASDEALFDAARIRLLSMLRQGTTTVEIKSGYGLSRDDELRILSIVDGLARVLPMSIVPTFMGAHAVPEESKRAGADAYVAEVIDGMLPAVAEQGIAQFCDVFCESSVFSIEQSRRVLEAGTRLGLGPKIHADEIVAGGEKPSGAELAAEVGAISADHLRETGPKGLEAMAGGGVVPVVLPATSFCLRDHRFADARAMIDGWDLPVALATDCNPGTSPTESLQLVMAIAALELRMKPNEILAGTTMNAARAVGMQSDVGSLVPGKRGDLVIWQAYELEMLSYRFGSNQASMVVAGGNIV